MKTYRAARDVLADVEKLIANHKPSPHAPTLLVKIVRLLCDSRKHYRVGIYLLADGRVLRKTVCGPELSQAQRDEEACVEFSVPIKIATQELGYLRAERLKPRSFAAEDRVLLKEVAHAVARYLTGQGKYVLRTQREAARAVSAKPAPQPEPPAYHPESERAANFRRAVAGEKARV